MSQPSREECIELGLSLPTSALVGWVTEQLAAAKPRQERLAGRGITAPFLKEVKNLVGTVAQLQIAIGKDKTSLLPVVTQSELIREEASAYLQEAKQIIKIEFGTCPEVQVKCRPGVRTGRLLANLCREMECVVSVLREHSPQLSWLGADEDFMGAGSALIGKVKEAKANLEQAVKALPPAVQQHCCEKGNLYDLCRKLVRIGQLEFLHEPEQAAAFNYTLLRRELRAGSEVRAKTMKSVAR
jgi:hypothetical protein